MVNTNQLEAIETLQGYVRVLAGAGSGKTLTSLTALVIFAAQKYYQ